MRTARLHAMPRQRPLGAAMHRQSMYDRRPRDEFHQRMSHGLGLQIAMGCDLLREVPCGSSVRPGQRIPIGRVLRSRGLLRPMRTGTVPAAGACCLCQRALPRAAVAATRTTATRTETRVSIYVDKSTARRAGPRLVSAREVGGRSRSNMGSETKSAKSRGHDGSGCDRPTAASAHRLAVRQSAARSGAHAR